MSYGSQKGVEKFPGGSGALPQPKRKFAFIFCLGFAFLLKESQKIPTLLVDTLVNNWMWSFVFCGSEEITVSGTKQGRFGDACL